MPSSTSAKKRTTTKTVKPTKSAAKAVKPAAKTPTAKRTLAARSAASPKPRSTKAPARKFATLAASGPLLTYDLIATRAHDLYVASGHQGHREVEFWLEAERQLSKRIKL